ncbi:MAG: NifU family protein [Dongiaceae bacterium]
MFIQTESTPNPSTLKFLPGVEVLTSGTADFSTPDSAKASPLAQTLFAINGVKGVFLGADFVTVTKDVKLEWPALKPLILAAIMEHFTSNKPVMLEGAAAPAANTNTGDAVIDQILELLETRVRPAVAQDGGNIEFDRFEDGIVYLRLQGSCAGCPSSTATLKSGIENMLRYYIPDIQEVRAV